MSAVRGQDFSIWQAIKENHQKAKQCCELRKSGIPQYRAYTARDRQQRTPVVRFNTRTSSAFTEYTIISMIARNACLADHDSTQVWSSGISLEPKNQRDARKRVDAEKWLAAEHVELRT
eukprot:2249220-Rhodomonas_salina.1